MNFIVKYCPEGDDKISWTRTLFHNKILSMTIFHYEILSVDSILYEILSDRQYFMGDNILCYNLFWYYEHIFPYSITVYFTTKLFYLPLNIISAFVKGYG